MTHTIRICTTDNFHGLQPSVAEGELVKQLIELIMKCYTRTVIIHSRMRWAIAMLLITVPNPIKNSEKHPQYLSRTKSKEIIRFIKVQSINYWKRYAKMNGMNKVSLMCISLILCLGYRMMLRLLDRIGYLWMGLRWNRIQGKIQKKVLGNQLIWKLRLKVRGSKVRWRSRGMGWKDNWKTICTSSIRPWKLKRSS